MSNFVRVDNIESSTHENGTDLHLVTVFDFSNVYYILFRIVFFKALMFLVLT